MSDPDLDRWLAEHLMGWGPTPGYWKVPNWSPTARIDQAWMVVEKIVEDGVVAVFVGEPTVGQCTCVISTDPSGLIRGRGVADTAPLAICRAIREARGEGELSGSGFT